MAMFRNFLLLIIFITLQSCVTREWQMENSICESEAFERFPPYIVKEFRTVYDTVTEPDGSVTCVNKSSHHSNDSTVVSHCQQGMRSRMIPRQELVDVDKNKVLRNEYAARCTSNRCLSIYGNAACEIPQ